MYLIAKNLPNFHKIFPMAVKCTKCPENILTSSIERTCQIGIFGLKMCHLATLVFGQQMVCNGCSHRNLKAVLDFYGWNVATGQGSDPWHWPKGKIAPFSPEDPSTNRLCFDKIIYL
jgi:hypothetical protein